MALTSTNARRFEIRGRGLGHARGASVRSGLMTRLARWSLGALVAWTAFVWTTRISNALEGNESTVDKATSIVFAVIFLAFAAGSVVLLVRLWRGALLDRSWAGFVALFAAWTTCVWCVRFVTIGFSGNTLAFKVVHIVLGLISIGLAALPAREAIARWSQPAAAV